jgi:5-aminolevulinate synthase
MENLNLFENFIQKIKSENRYRNFFEMTRIKDLWPVVKHKNRDVTVFCGTDYLSMSIHPVVTAAVQEVVLLHGVGSGGTRNIAGTYDYIVELEKSLADLHNKDAGLVFSSGYLSNFAAISAIGRISEGEMVIFSDELNHSSIIEGIRSSGCKKEIFRHNDFKHLEELISQHAISIPKLIIFESVYSMNGSIAPIEEFIKVAKKYNALTYIDEVHADGVYGNRGAGVCDILKVSDQIDIIQGSLSKGFGLIGGYITGQSTIIDAIRSCSSGFIFTSTMPIPIAAGCLASVNHLKESSKERELHWSNVNKFLKLFESYSIPLISSQSNIMSVPIAGAAKVAEVSKYLLEKYDIYVQHINYPTVKRGEERLRITTNPSHNSEMIEKCVIALSETMKILKTEDWSKKKIDCDYLQDINFHQMKVMESMTQ